MIGFRADPRIPEPPWEPMSAPPGDVVDEAYPIGTGMASGESPRLDDEPVDDSWVTGNVAIVVCGIVAVTALVSALLTVWIVVEALT